MKLSRITSILAVFLLLITCMMVFAVNIGYAADTTQTAISTAGSTTTNQPNPLAELGGYALTIILTPIVAIFTNWLSKRLTKAKYVPKSVAVWLDQIEESDITDAITEARKLIGMTPAERMEWARKYLQDRYKQLPSNVANKLLEDKYQEIVKTPQLI